MIYWGAWRTFVAFPYTVMDGSSPPLKYLKHQITMCTSAKATKCFLWNILFYLFWRVKNRSGNKSHIFDECADSKSDISIGTSGSRRLCLFVYVCTYVMEQVDVWKNIWMFTFDAIMEPNTDVGTYCIRPTGSHETQVGRLVWERKVTLWNINISILSPSSIS